MPDRAFEPSAFGPYALQSVVASDLTTTTYRASPGGGAADVALRVVEDHVAAHPRAVKGFLHVNHRISAVEHPHLLAVVDQGTHAGMPYAATVWRDGLLLAELLLEYAPLDVGEVLRLGGHLAEALDTAHDHGIVHGTVGLQTVWIRRRPSSRVPPSAALTAFGTSHLLAPILHRVEDEEAAVDLLFVAPEQLHGAPAGPAADQYALTCVLYTALTGTTPFRGETNSDLFGAHLYGDVAPVTSVRDDLDERWDEVFARGLARKPDERYDNCRTLLLAAGRAGYRRHAVTDVGTGQVVTTQPGDVDEFERAPRRTVQVVLLTLLLLLLAVLVLVGAIELGLLGTGAGAGRAAVSALAEAVPVGSRGG